LGLDGATHIYLTPFSKINSKNEFFKSLLDCGAGEKASALKEGLT
jgi:hypothetical protein